MAAIAVTMIVGAVLNASAFTGSMYLAKALAGDKKHTDEEKIRHDKALELYQHDYAQWQHKRQQYQDWLMKEYTDKKIADETLNNTDMGFRLYSKTHPDFNLKEPQIGDYYKPSRKQKQYQMIYVGGGMLTAGFLASKFM